MTNLITIQPDYPSLSAAQLRKGSAPDAVNDNFFGSFGDILDTINPLQHIPIVSNIYQSMTGDTQSAGAKLAGGALFGGPVGFLASLFDSMVEGETGKNMGAHIVAMFQGSSADETKEANNSAGVTKGDVSYPNSAYLKAASLL